MIIKAVNKAGERVKKGQKVEEKGIKECEFCLSKVPAGATKCAYCASKLKVEK